MSDDGGAVERALHRAGERDEPWPEEPDEFDPGSLGPGPTGDDGVDRDVDSRTFRSFWSAVLLADVGLFGVVIGPMIWYFRGQMLLGGGMFLVGAIALARTYRIQRNYRRDRADADESPAAVAQDTDGRGDQ